MGWKKRGREIEREAEQALDFTITCARREKEKEQGGKETKKREEKNRIQKKQI